MGGHHGFLSIDPRCPQPDQNRRIPMPPPPGVLRMKRTPWHAGADPSARHPCRHGQKALPPQESGGRAIVQKVQEHAKTWNPVQHKFMGGSAPAACCTTKKSPASGSGLLSSRANWIAAPAPESAAGQGQHRPLPGTPVQQTANSSLTLGFSRSSAPESWIAAPAFAASRP